MKFRSSLLVVLLFGLIIYGAKQKQAAYEEKESFILHGLTQVMDYAHFDPKTIDDEFSTFVYNTYLERIDGAKRFLTQEEIDQLDSYKFSLDEQVKTRSFEFFDKSLELLDLAQNRAKNIFNQVIVLKHDYSEDENIELDYDKRNYAANQEELFEVWRKTIKYEIMIKYSSLIEDQENPVIIEKSNDETIEAPKYEDFSSIETTEKVKKSNDELLTEATEKVKKNFDDWFGRIEKLRREDRFQTYLGSISNYYDPHTDYFSPKEKEDFDINMGGKLEGIGARLSSDGEYTKVISIVPGGPAYKNKELEVNDLIYKVKQEDEEEAVEIGGMRIDDVVQKIRGKKGTIVTLTVKKEDGSFKDINIERDEVILDEGFAKSVIVDFPGLMNNVGFIKLPKFYSSFEKEDGSSCAVDVAREIEKLKAENVNGIILDLRNNTGGSLQDVIKMSGLFIEEGPIVQVKSRSTKPYVHKDSDSSVQYDGPLIVMVNNFSASASEILAAALQDYGRAIIVGSKSTFGKGTVQRFFDLDNALRGNEEMKPLGNVKITVQKFYRINGGSTQLKGVVPDIILPDNYHYIDVGEKEYENALAWTEIAPVEYSQNVVKLDHLLDLKLASENRIKDDENFSLVLQNAKRLKENKEMTNYPINLKEFDALMDKKEEEAKKFENLYDEKIPNLNIMNLPSDLAEINMDQSRIDRNKDWIDGLSKDFYLFETLNVMRDMISKEPSFASIEKKLDERK